MRYRPSPHPGQLIVPAPRWRRGDRSPPRPRPRRRRESGDKLAERISALRRTGRASADPGSSPPSAPPAAPQRPLPTRRRRETPPPVPERGPVEPAAEAPPAPAPAAAPKIDFRIVDSLRGIAALYVVVNHSRGQLFAGGAAYEQAHPRDTWGLADYLFLSATQLTRLSSEAVIIFFVLSGFSIAYSLSRRGPMIGFWARRLVRLYPPYLVGLLWAAAVFLLLRSSHPGLFSCSGEAQLYQALCETRGFLEPTTIARNLVYDPQGAIIAQYWSLPHELLFYALAPLLMLRVKWYLIASGVLFVLSIGATGIALRGGHGMLGDYILAYNPYFAVGVLLFTQWHPAQRLLTVGRFTLVVLGGVAFLMMVALSAKTGIASKPAAVIAALLACLLVVNFQAHQIRIRPLMWIGKFSYTLYVTHLATLFACLSLVFSFTGERPPDIFNRYLWVLAIPVCVVVAWIFYFAAERWSKAIIDHMRRAPGTGTDNEPRMRTPLRERVPLPVGRPARPKWARLPAPLPKGVLQVLDGSAQRAGRGQPEPRRRT